MNTRTDSGTAVDAPPFVTIAVLSYNERDTLERVVEQLRTTIARLGRSFEILIVDDGSTDGSSGLADRLAESSRDIRVAHHQSNLGLGGAYRTAFREARGAHLTCFPADGQFPATILEDFTPRIEAADMVLGYLPPGNQTFADKFWSHTERLLYRLVLGPVPRFQGIFMIRRRVIGEMQLQSAGRGWAIVMELIIKVARDSRFVVVGVPTVMLPRSSGRSKVRNLKTVVANAWQIVRLRAYL